MTRLCALAALALAAACAAQAPRENGGGAGALAPLPAGAVGKRGGAECGEWRRLDGTCTSLGNKLWGSSRRPLLEVGARAGGWGGVQGRGARWVSNALCAQRGDVWSRRALSELAVFFGQFIDHVITAVPEDGDAVFMPVPEDDPLFANFTEGLHFRRSEYGPVGPAGSNRTAPINALPSALDLSAVYGADGVRAAALRAAAGGKLVTSNRTRAAAGRADMLPYNRAGLLNAPAKTPAFFLAGDHRANEHPVLTALHTVFLREHNALCDELAAAFPDWDSERLYQTARKVNGAQFQKIVYEEFYPAFTGRALPARYAGHKPDVDPTISAVFSTAAFRIGHTMVGNELRPLGARGRRMKAVRMAEMFFRPQHTVEHGIDPFLRGAAFYRAQEVDLKVHDSLRNFLFTGVAEEKGFDLVALNIHRARDNKLPDYNSIRELYGRARARSFRDITRSRSRQSALSSVYASVDAIDAWIGLLAEDHAPGASMGRTMLAVWDAEFTRMRDGDRFFYERPDVLDPELLMAVPRLQSLPSFRRILLRNTDIKPRELPRNVFFARGRGGRRSGRRRRRRRL